MNKIDKLFLDLYNYTALYHSGDESAHPKMMAVQDEIRQMIPCWSRACDKLPEEEKKVLIYGEKFGIDLDKVTYPKDGNIWNATNLYDVSHWAYLPEPPEA